jgi:hypothetical protein
MRPLRSQNMKLLKRLINPLICKNNLHGSVLIKLAKRFRLMSLKTRRTAMGLLIQNNIGIDWEIRSKYRLKIRRSKKMMKIVMGSLTRNSIGTDWETLLESRSKLTVWIKSWLTQKRVNKSPFIHLVQVWKPKTCKSQIKINKRYRRMMKKTVMGSQIQSNIGTD